MLWVRPLKAKKNLKSLDFPYIPWGCFHWIVDFGLTVLSFDYLKNMMPLFPASMVSSIWFFFPYRYNHCFSLAWFQAFFFVFSFSKVWVIYLSVDFFAFIFIGRYVCFVKFGAFFSHYSFKYFLSYILFLFSFWDYYYYYYCYYFFFFCFLGSPMWHMMVPRLGVE